MSNKTHFPGCNWIVKTLTGRLARRIYASILLFTVILTTALHLRSYFMARKIQAVLRGLAEIRVDQTTEQQLTKMVPYVAQKDRPFDGISYHVFNVDISNQSDRLPRIIVVAEQMIPWIERLVTWMGYRFMSFNATVLVQDAKVVHVDYGLQQVAWPEFPGYMGYLVSARSVHGFWLPHQRGFEVSSVDDDSPRYRPGGNEHRLRVIYTSDAPPEMIKPLFRLNLSCFWSLGGCNDAQEIAPELWHDAQAIREASYEQLISENCPDSIIEGRMRYLPDVSVLLLEVTGSRRVQVNEEGDHDEDWFTDYKLKEVIRGRSFGSWKNVRFRKTIRSTTDPTQTISNQIWPEAKIGTQVLFFGTMRFDSCRFIPATPSALKIVRNTPVPPKRPEDQIPRGLM